MAQCRKDSCYFICTYGTNRQKREAPNRVLKSNAEVQDGIKQ